MDAHRPLAYTALLILGVVGATILGVFVAKTYPLEPKILDITLPLEIVNKEIRPGEFLYYRTTFEQYERLEADIITYLVPAHQPEMKIQLLKIETVIPKTTSQKVENSIAIPENAVPGEYFVSIHVDYEWNIFRRVSFDLDSERFDILKPDGTKAPRQEPPGKILDSAQEFEEAEDNDATINVQGSAEVIVRDSETPPPSFTPFATTIEPTPTPTVTLTPTPFLPIPLPTLIPISMVNSFRTCKDFKTQAAATRAYVLDPVGLANLDADADRRACEALP